MTINWSLQNRKLSDLKDHPKNPRYLSKEAAASLTESLEKFGLAEKIIINTDGTIIGGHQRKSILKKLKYKEVECWVPDQELTTDQVDELNIRLNKNIGDWDYDILANQWDFDKLTEWGFSAEELLDAPITDTEGEAEEGSEALEPGKDEDAITKLGDVYELNGHRIGCGDSTDAEMVRKVLMPQLLQPILMVTDPPYGVEYDPGWRENAPGSLGKKWATGKVKNDNRTNWALSWHLFPGSIAYVWHPAKHCLETGKSLSDSGYEIISQIIWVKSHLVFSRGDYHWQHEPCWYAVKKDCGHNWRGDRKQTTIWEIQGLGDNYNKQKNESDERTAHSTQKPIECMARPIRNNSAPGEGVYDPFLGSGTTLIAAEQLGRICYGIEISPAYVDIAVNRWKNYMENNNKEFSINKNGESIEWADIQNQ